MMASVNEKDNQESQPHDKFAKCGLKSRIVAIDFLAAHRQKFTE
ncbi:MAG: hypothetical protein AB2993_05180 [Candidatus Symbiodolus clandestinus]